MEEFSGDSNKLAEYFAQQTLGGYSGRPSLRAGASRQPRNAQVSCKQLRRRDGVPQENSPMITNLRGILAPALTAVTDNFKIHPELTIAHYKWLLANGCDGLVVFGTTSEANSFSIAERKQFLEQVVGAGIDPKKIIVGTGCCALSDSIELTSHAVQIGCAGALTLPPFYYKQLTDEGLFRYFASLVEGVSDPRCRLYLYHIPPIAIVSFSFSLIEKLITHYPEIVAGIKDSSGEWEHTRQLIERFANPRFDVFPGNESAFLPALRIGAAGCISGAANVNAQLLQLIFQTWQTAEADARQMLVQKLRQVFLGYPLIPALKAIISRMRREPGWKNVQPPLAELTETELEGFFEKLSVAGFEWPAGSDGAAV
jgi:4-hydroxy-tetrahydrodipicolinate synthase